MQSCIAESLKILVYTNMSQTTKALEILPGNLQPKKSHIVEEAAILNDPSPLRRNKQV